VRAAQWQYVSLPAVCCLQFARNWLVNLPWPTANQA